MANVAVTYSFTNGTTADGTQVSQNFTDIINGTSDGTKSFSISALSCAGAATLNGAVTLGASTSNLIVFNGAVNSTIPVNTNTTYDFGSSIKGLLSVYLGGSGAFTTRILGGTLGASYTLTLPTSTGTTGQFPVTDGTGVLSFRYPDKVLTSQTANLNLTGSETFVPCTVNAGAFTVTLPAAASFTGKRYVIMRTDNNRSNNLTIQGNAAETIVGAGTSSNTFLLCTQNESLEIICDGTQWNIVSHRYDSTTVSDTNFSANGFGTILTPHMFTRRYGDQLVVNGNFQIGTAAASQAYISMSTGYAYDTAKGTTSANVWAVGRWYRMRGDATVNTINVDPTSQGPLFADGTNTAQIFFAYTAHNATFDKVSGSVLCNTSDTFGFEFSVPITNWKG